MLQIVFVIFIFLSTTFSSQVSAASCLDYEVNMPGYDIRDLTTPTVMDCQSECQKEVRCFFFTYRISSLKCFLKEAAAETNAYGPIEDHVSGPKVCGGEGDGSSTTPTPTSVPCYMHNTDYTGAYDVVDDVASPEVCQAKCRDADRCKAFAFSTSRNRCYLQHDDSTTRPYPGFIAGPKVCPTSKPTTPTPRWCFDDGVNMPGYDIRQERTASVSDCQLACQAEPRCFFFTYRVSQKNCFLKDAAAETDAYGPIDDHVSGGKFCEEDEVLTTVTPPPRASCTAKDTNMIGHDVELIFSVKTVDECQDLCVADSRCFFFVFHDERQACYLKSAEAAVSVLPQEGYFSGPKVCLTFSTTTVSPMTSRARISCALSGTILPGNDIGFSFEAKTTEECQDLCAADVNCFFFSFHISRNACYLKSESAQWTSRPEAGYDSGPKVCLTTTPTPMSTSSVRISCAVPNTNMPGNDVGLSFAAKTPDECQDQCAANPSCFFFSFHLERNACYLKGPNANASSRTEVGFSSGPKACPPSS